MCVCVFILVVVLPIAGQGFREECFPMFAKGSRSVVHVELPVVYIVHALTIWLGRFVVLEALCANTKDTKQQQQKIQSFPKRIGAICNKRFGEEGVMAKAMDSICNTSGK